ncbi:caprin homolog isoform X2 [Anabrus simplex]|uniref:caprin homolog isoform X2 n=1 Tax=Anabrus simplex TaxID=316456 RepID=UPI0034DCEC1C
MASKVLVKIPTVPFSQVNKKGPELAAIGRSEGLMVTPTSDPLLRIAQLEQNIRFLQEQHQIMLASLHQEVDQLRQRNRDLQFQLVFTKGGVTLVQSSPSPSSPEDDSKPKIILSPKQVNMTPLQVELLEKEVAELKNSLSEARTKNLYLSGIVEEQKKKIDSLEHGKQELEAVGSKIGPNAKTDAQNQAGSNSKNVTATEGTEADLTFKLEEAERVIRRLRRDNEEHRRELVTIKSNLSKSLTGAGGNRQLGGGGNNSHRGNGGAGGGNSHHRPHNQQQSQTQRFPPLHTQSYWHHGQHSQHRTGMEFVSHRHCANGGGSSGGGNGGGGGGSRLEKETQVVGRPAPSLPNLRNNSTSSGYTFSNGNGNNNGSNHRRGGGHYNGNGNHYYRSGNKGGGGRANRESRDRGDGK